MTQTTMHNLMTCAECGSRMVVEEIYVTLSNPPKTTIVWWCDCGNTEQETREPERQKSTFERWCELNRDTPRAQQFFKDRKDGIL